MKTIHSLRRLLALSATALVLGLGTTHVKAQRPDRGNFDPEQARQQMMERTREQLEVKSDDEWKLIEQRITKVFEARRELGSGRGGFGRPGGGRRGGEGDRPNNPGDNNNDRRQRGGGGEPNPDEEALRASLDAKAAPEEIKAKLAKVRAVRKEKQANLEKAQEELRQVLSVRQEALAVMSGLLS